jgi:hypothetical protein
MTAATVETWSDVPKDQDFNMWKIGPCIVLQALAGEFYATMQVCYTQANMATCVLTTWEIDGEVKAHQLSGSNEDWPRFWSAFLGLLPSEIAPLVHKDEATVRF